MVRALLFVGTFSRTEKEEAEAALITVNFPSPQEANTRPVPASKPTPSQPSPIGRVLTIAPLAASTTTSDLSQPEKSRLVFVSMASPVGPSAFNGQLATTALLRMSTTVILFLSS